MDYYNIGGTVKNNKAQELRIETEGDSIIFSIVEDRKVTKFEITYDNKMAFEDIRQIITKCQSHITKNHAIKVRDGQL
jgi:hypothetical protein